MPSVRFVVASFVLILLMYGLASAQTRPAASLADAPGLQRLQERIASLDLSDDQKKQVDALEQEIAETVRGIAPQLKDASPEDRRKQIRAALGDVREKFTSILTPEQKRKLADERGAKRVPGRRPLADIQADKKADEKEAKQKAADLPMIARLREALDDVGLSPEQKAKTDAVLDDAGVQARQLLQDAAGDRNGAREKAAAVIRETRDKLAAVLTPEQKKQLAESMPRPGDRAGNRAGRRNRDGPPATRPANSQSPDPAAAKAAAGPSAAPAAPVKPAPATPAVAVTAGSPAPAFTLTRLSGSDVTLKSLAGKPLVLVFGSLSSPSVRDRLPKLDALKTKYRGRAVVLLAYTREAHPADGWQVERNRDDKIDVNQPTTLDQRTALAKRLRDTSKTSLDIAVDAVDDPTAAAYGLGGEAAVVISPYGTVIGTQQYCDPSGLPRLIDAAIGSKE